MRKTAVLLVLLTVVAAWLAPVPARAEDGEDTADALVQKKQARPVVAYWKNDLFLSTPDEDIWLRIRGNLHFDSKIYGSDSGNPAHLDVRRARFDFQGLWYHWIAFRCQAEFADKPYARNFWADFKFADVLHLRAGQMKPPFSTSWWTTDNNVNFLERGAGTPMYPYFDRGWWLWGEILDATVTWNLAAFTGAGMDFDYPKGDVDDHKDVVARLFCAPFAGRDGSPLQGLALCVEGSTGKQTVPTARFEGRGYGAAVRDDKFWTWEATDARIDNRERWGGELHYISGPFSLSGEYLVTEWDEIAVDGAVHGGKVSSASGWLSLFLTGERKRVGNFGWKQPAPRTDFAPGQGGGSGAWEILARYTRTETSRCLFDAGILAGAPEVDEFSVGLSWTWNPMVRWQLNYVHLEGEGIRTGSADSGGPVLVDEEDMFGLRMIFKF